MNSKRIILFGLFYPSRGGHTRSAIGIAKALREWGFDVQFLVIDGEDDALLREHNLKTIHIKYTDLVLGRRGAFPANGIAALHHFTDRLVPEAALLARALQVRFAITVPGQLGRAVHIQHKPTFVFQDDAASAFVERGFPPENLEVSAGRIFVPDLAVSAERVADVRMQVLGAAGLRGAPDPLVICRSCRLTPKYLQPLERVAEALAATARGRDIVIALHGGHAPSARERNEHYDRLMQFSDRSSTVRIVHIPDAEMTNVEILAASDLVLGVGQSALLGLMLGLPVAVPSPDGTLWLLKDVDAVIRSGRFNHTDRSAAAGVGDWWTADRAIDHLPYSSSRAERIREWALEEYSSDSSAHRYAQYYNDGRFVDNYPSRFAILTAYSRTLLFRVAVQMRRAVRAWL